MIYFVDAEYANRSLIEISIINDETGECFSSYVKYKFNVPYYVTQLTGITTNKVRNAPSISNVFSCIYNWIGKLDKTNDIFYFYGNTDKIVLTEINYRLQNKTLSHILAHYRDFAEDVNTKFSLVKPVSLQKLVSYYRKAETLQSHTAENDTRDLQFIYHKVLEDTTTEIAEFKEYQSLAPNKHFFLQIDRDANIINKFDCLNDAVDWIISLPFNTNRKKVDRQSIFNHLKMAIKCNEPYYGYVWKKVSVQENE